MQPQSPLMIKEKGIVLKFKLTFEFSSGKAKVLNNFLFTNLFLNNILYC